MTAQEWLKKTLESEYGTKANAVYDAIINSREIRFSSPESEAKFSAILREWNCRGDAEMDAEPEQDAGGYAASNRMPADRATKMAATRARISEPLPEDPFRWTH